MRQLGDFLVQRGVDLVVYLYPDLRLFLSSMRRFLPASRIF